MPQLSYKELKKLVRTSFETSTPIFTASPYSSDRLDDIADRMGLDIPEPIIQGEPGWEERLKAAGEVLRDGTI